MPIRRAVFWLVVGLVLLIVSSRILVWGAVEIAHGFGVSDLIIGLTIVAVGTSLPELASSIIAARKGEHDIALGNILGSNLFNTLAVVGIAGAIHPMAVGPEVFNRDMLVMAALTLSLFVIGYGFRGPGRINRIEGAVLLACYVGYTAYLISTVVSHEHSAQIIQQTQDLTSRHFSGHSDRTGRLFTAGDQRHRYRCRTRRRTNGCFHR
jgi:cation:H+ antiporter